MARAVRWSGRARSDLRAAVEYIKRHSPASAARFLKEGLHTARSLESFPVPTSYGGGSGDVTAEQLQAYVDDVAAGRVPVALDRTFTPDEIVEAHRHMEANKARGKVVVLP